MNGNRKKIVKYLKRRLESKPWDSYICIDRNILERIVRMLEAEDN